MGAIIYFLTSITYLYLHQEVVTDSAHRSARVSKANDPSITSNNTPFTFTAQKVVFFARFKYLFESLMQADAFLLKRE